TQPAPIVYRRCFYTDQPILYMLVVRSDDINMEGRQQLLQVLDRLEDEAEREQEALRLRIDAERSEVKATMTFSRASAIKSVEQQMELSKAREAEGVWLRAQQESAASAAKAPSPSGLSLTLPEPEPTRAHLVGDGGRLLCEENRRLAQENERLVEEASLLRSEAEEAKRLAEELSALHAKEEEGSTAVEACSLRGDMSVAGASGGGECNSGPRVGAARAVAGGVPASPAEGQRPTTEVSGVMLPSGVRDSGSNGVVGAAAVWAVQEPPTSANCGLAAASFGRLGLMSIEPGPSPAWPRRSSATGGSALSDNIVSVSNSSSNNSRGERDSRSEGGERQWEEEEDDEEEQESRRKGELQRAIEEEAERVYLELRANPPPAIRALLAARGEMDKLAAEARSTLEGLKQPPRPPAAEQVKPTVRLPETQRSRSATPPLVDAAVNAR
ncbi:unnamed protein product, partial [Ectocarpus sp. 12 AP-2014]